MAWYFLTEEQVALLQEVIDAHRGGRINPPTPRSSSVTQSGRSPERYIAKTPADGIPACDLSGSPNDEPGSAVCDVYRIWEGAYGTAVSPGLHDVDFIKLVYNIHPNPVPGGIYVLVSKTKYGIWAVDTGAQGFLCFGKMNAQLTQGSSAAASIWTFNGSSWSDSGDDELLYDWLLGTGQTVDTGTKIVAGFHGDYRIAIAAGCP